MSRVRQILPGLTYTYPPAQDKLAPDTVTPEALKARWEAARDPAREAVRQEPLL